ncbi:hypothetical protein, partial [Duodenibacillus massiliensis]|uniref:hypothetical protein n=1 Tax=Duodenibacillus massiliensis TaxID=1852381 RepID=UPI003F7EC44E
CPAPITATSYAASKNFIRFLSPFSRRPDFNFSTFFHTGFSTFYGVVFHNHGGKLPLHPCFIPCGYDETVTIHHFHKTFHRFTARGAWKKMPLSRGFTGILPIRTPDFTAFSTVPFPPFATGQA